MKTPVCLVSFVFAALTVHGQQTCQVRLPEIEGKYIGGCKKGYAEGEGTATGLYMYQGAFKKGAPHGQGRMEWNADSVFVGEWKKGQRSGEGVLVVRGDSLTGFWAKDDYIGKENFRYKLISNVNEISKVTFTRLDNAMNRIEIRYEKETVPLALGNPIVVVSQGSWNRIPRGNRYVVVLEQVEYPFQATISNQFEFVINQPGHWDILVLITPTRN